MRFPARGRGGQGIAAAAAGWKFSSAGTAAAGAVPHSWGVVVQQAVAAGAAEMSSMES